MPISLLFTLAWRNLIRNARRSLFGLATIALGVTGLALAGGFIQDVFEQLGEATISAQLGHLQVTRQGFREIGAGAPQQFLVQEPEKLKLELLSDSRVVEAMGRLSFSALLASDGSDLAVEAEGVESGPEARLGSRVQFLEGRNLQAGDSATAVLGEGVAKQLRTGAGRMVTLTAPTLDGALNVVDLEVVGVFRSFSKEFDDRAVRVTLTVAQELLQAQAVNTIVVQLGRTSDTNAVLKSVASQISGVSLDVKPWYVISDFYGNTKAMYAKQFGFLRLIALVLVLMSVVNTLNMTVFERTAEFGTMRVLGNRSLDVIKLIMLEACLLGLVSAIAGVLLSMVAAALISQVGIPMPPPPNMEGGYTARILLTPLGLLEVSAIGVIASTLAALFPALRFARLSLVEALRRAS